MDSFLGFLQRMLEVILLLDTNAVWGLFLILVVGIVPLVLLRGFGDPEHEFGMGDWWAFKLGMPAATLSGGIIAHSLRHTKFEDGREAVIILVIGVATYLIMWQKISIPNTERTEKNTSINRRTHPSEWYQCNLGLPLVLTILPISWVYLCVSDGHPASAKWWAFGIAIGPFLLGLIIDMLVQKRKPGHGRIKY